MPACCDGTLIYETPSAAQIVLLTQAAQALHAPTLPPGVPSATAIPPLEYLAPSGQWTVYTDPTHGYSFEYPANWFIYQQGDGTITIPIFQSSESRNPLRCPSVSGWIYIALRIWEPTLLSVLT
jgi:hypothetical protein